MIELAKANPDPETLKVLLWLSGALILILFGIIGYFVKEKISSQRKELEGKEKGQKEQLDKLGAVVETIQKAVVNLDKVVKVMTGWTPDTAVSLYQKIVPPGEIPNWNVNDYTTYQVGTKVKHKGVTYQCVNSTYAWIEPGTQDGHFGWSVVV